MALINQPPLTDVDTKLGQGWAEWLSSAFTILTNVTQSGTTAQRPVTMLYVGRTYFDTTINRPIWYTGTNWIRADGVVV